MDTVQLTLELPREVFSALRKDPDMFLREMRLAAAVKWYDRAGESAVLAHALAHPGWKAVSDDGAARRCARVLAIPFIGTLGIIIRARQSGLIPQAIPLLKELKNHGFHLDDAVIRIAL